MSLKPEPIPPIPEETIRVAKAAFPKGNIYMRIRDRLGVFYEDEQFQFLFSSEGQPGENPWRLALISVMQFIEDLSDRQAAEAVRSRIDWKYALSLELTDSGFDYSVLSEFRCRVLNGGIEQQLLDTMLSVLQEAGLVKKGGKQRTDSSHVLGAVRVLNRLENLGETLRATLNSLAAANPDWLLQVVPPEWFDRYSRRIEEYRLPNGEKERKELAEIIGNDGTYLLTAIYREDTPGWMGGIPAVEILRQTWLHQYYIIDGRLCLRKAEDLPPASIRHDSPYDPETHYGTKGSESWTGYRVHLTETCDVDCPHIITHVETTISPKQDVEMTEPIHEALSEKGLEPARHLVDSGYVDAGLIINSQKEYEIELVGPVRPDSQWQAKQGYGIDRFDIDWVSKSVTCPGGQTSQYWKTYKDSYGKEVNVVRFPTSVCSHCENISLCTKAKSKSRMLTIRTESYQAGLSKLRREQTTEEWKEEYQKRAGIEGTLSQGIRGFGLRQARYIGLAKTHLQHVLTAVAINMVRVNAWLIGTPLAKTRISRFSALQLKAS